METLGQFQGRVTQTPIGSGTNQDILIGLINDAIEEICRSTEWSRLEKQSVLQTVAPYQTGTVNVTVGSTLVTVTGGTFTSDMTGRFFRVLSELEYYGFTFASASTGNLDRAYEAADDAADAQFVIYKSVYELPSDVQSIRSLAVLNPGYDLDEITREELDRMAASRQVQTGFQTPEAYAPAEDSANGLAQIELWPPPSEAIGMPMRYYAKPPLFETEPQLIDTSATFPDWISIPCVYASVMADLHRLQKEFAEASQWEQLFQMRLKVMQQEDARKRPPTVLREADRYTEHRFKRATGRYRNVYRNWQGMETS